MKRGSKHRKATLKKMSESQSVIQRRLADLDAKAGRKHTNGGKKLKGES